MSGKIDVKRVFGATDAAALAEKLGEIVSRAGKSGASSTTGKVPLAKEPGYVDASVARAAAKKFAPTAHRGSALYRPSQTPAAPVARHAAPSAAQRKVAAQLMELAKFNPIRAAAIFGKMFESAELGRDVRGQFVTTEDETATA